MTLAVPSASNTKVSLREACFADYPRIAALQAKYDVLDSGEAWTWFWVENPVLQEVEQWPIGWVLETKAASEIVGYIGNIPLAYEFKGKKIIAAVPRAWVVHSDFRSYSFVLLNHFFNQNTADLCLATTMNLKAARTMEALGGLRVPVGAWDESLYWITHHRTFLASALSRKGISAGKYLAYPLSAIAWSADALRVAALRRKSDHVQLIVCKTFDSRFDRFWSDLKAHSPYLTARRTSEILNWHFKSALLHDRIWVLAAGNESRIQAYAIFLRRDIHALAFKRVMLVDFQALEGKHALLMPMLEWALKKCSDEGVSMLEVVGFAREKRDMVLELAPYRRSLSSWPYFYKAKSESLARSLAGASSWDPSMFDGDSSLCI